jgi:Fe-S-cluster containining protein
MVDKIEVGKTYRCAIYENRPDICKTHPQIPSQLIALPTCSYYFENEERKGECNRCGQCCINMTFDGVRYEICPYLEEE